MSEESRQMREDWETGTLHAVEVVEDLLERVHQCKDPASDLEFQLSELKKIAVSFLTEYEFYYNRPSHPTGRKLLPLEEVSKLELPSISEELRRWVESLHDARQVFKDAHEVKLPRGYGHDKTE